MTNISLSNVIDEIKNTNSINELIFDSISTSVDSLKPHLDFNTDLINETLEKILDVIKNLGSPISIVNPANNSSTAITPLKSNKAKVSNKSDKKMPDVDIGGLLKGAMLNLAPDFLFNSYVKGIKKLVDAIKTIDVSNIDKKVSSLAKLSDVFKTIGNISWSKIMIGSFKIKRVAASYGAAMEALVKAIGKIKVSKTLQEKIAVFSHILDPLKTLQDLKLGKVLLATASLLPISKGIVLGIAPLLKITTAQLNKMSKIGKSLKEIFKPIFKFLSSVSTSMIKGGVGLVLIAGSLAVAAYSLSKFGAVSWESVGKGLLTLGALAGVAYIIGKSTTSFLKGALGIAALGVAMIPLAYALDLMKEVGIGTIGVLAAGLLTLGVAAAIFGIPAVAPFIFLGALAIAALGLALIPFAYSMSLMKDVNWEDFKTGGEALLAFSVGAIPLALAAPGLLLGAVGLGLFAGAVKLLNMAIGSNGKSMADFMDNLTNMSQNISGRTISGIAVGLGELSLAVAAFGAAKAIDGIGSFFGKLLGGKNPIDELIRLAEKGADLSKIGDGVMNIAKGIRAMGDASSGLLNLSNLDISKLEDLAKFENARAAGYTSWKDYEGHDFKWRTNPEESAIQAAPSTTGVIMNQDGSKNVGSSRGGTMLAINTGGNTSTVTNSSNVSTTNSTLYPSTQGSSLMSVYNDNY